MDDPFGDRDYRRGWHENSWRNATSHQCPANHVIGQCENKERVLAADGMCGGDLRQLRARLLLDLSGVPEFASYDALVAEKAARWGRGTKKHLAHPEKM
jgi:hypothetical protein